MKKKNLTDLEKARDHFIRATTESIIGAGVCHKRYEEPVKAERREKTRRRFCSKVYQNGNRFSDKSIKGI